MGVKHGGSIGGFATRGWMNSLELVKENYCIAMKLLKVAP